VILVGQSNVLTIMVMVLFLCTLKAEIRLIFCCNATVFITYVAPNCYPMKAIFISSVAFMLSDTHYFCSVVA